MMRHFAGVVYYRRCAVAPPSVRMSIKYRNIIRYRVFPVEMALGGIDQDQASRAWGNGQVLGPLDLCRC